MIVVSKKWHVAKRLTERIRQVVNFPAIDYLFNEESTPLPDLGGIQSSLGKRTRHRRWLMRMLFDYYSTDRLLVCMDPSNIDLLNDFCGDRAKTKVLEIESNFTDEYLIGHAMRVGLAGERTPQDALERLLPTLRNDIAFESDRIREADYEGYARIRESDPVEQNAAKLAQFLAIPQDKAHEIASTHYLFSD